MRKFIVVCIGLLLTFTVAGAGAQVVTPKAMIDAPIVRPPVLPDLRGKTCDEARAMLSRLHVELTECRPGTARMRYPAGTINAQSAAPGTPVSSLDGLRVTYEPVPARAPDKAPESAPRPDRAPESAPRADTAPDPSRSGGATVPVVPSILGVIVPAIIDAANERKLPDVRGMSCDQARDALRPLRIALAECAPGSAGSRYPAGTINAQTPAPGTPASRTKELRAQTEPLSPPPPDAARVLPDLRGMSCEQARAALRPLGLALVDCLPGTAGSRYPAGTISAQSQPPGTPLSRVDRLRARFEPVPAPPEPQRLLPDLRGMTCDEAAAALGALDLRYTSCAPGAPVDGARPGRINGQSPAAGTALPLAGPLVLRVQPVPPVIVPALIGLGEAQAASALASRKLQPRASGPAAAQGRRVLSQNPAAGTAVAPGSAVEFALGLSVPRLQGLDCAAARARAAEFGHRDFDCASRPAESPDAPIGRVFEQSPEAGGAAIPAPAAIRVAVWAAQPVTVPDVRERVLDEAISAIEAARLVAQPDARQGERIVAQQAPAPGTVVDAGSAVRLETREVVEVPDVVGQMLDTARATLQQSRLRDAADAQDHAGERIVQSQAPAAHARVAADSAVQLSTKRFADVPDLGGLTCDAARAAVAPDTFELQCNDESSWRTTVFGTPLVQTQSPGARARAEVGATIIADARAPLPPWAAPLRDVPLAVVAGVAVAPLLGLALWLAWPRPVPSPSGGSSQPSAAPRAARPIVSPIPPRAPSFAWRVDPDAAPAVSLRWPPAGKGVRRASQHAASGIAWRVVPDAGHVLLREFDVSSGGDHADR